MSIVILILHQTRTVLGDTDVREFTNDAAEIRRHKKTFEPGYPLFMELLVDEAQEINEVIHCLTYMFYCQTVRSTQLRLKQSELIGAGIQAETSLSLAIR